MKKDVCVEVLRAETTFTSDDVVVVCKQLGRTTTVQNLPNAIWLVKSLDLSPGTPLSDITLLSDVFEMK